MINMQKNESVIRLRGSEPELCMCQCLYIIYVYICLCICITLCRHVQLYLHTWVVEHACEKKKKQPIRLQDYRPVADSFDKLELLKDICIQEEVGNSEICC